MLQDGFSESGPVRYLLLQQQLDHCCKFVSSLLEGNGRVLCRCLTNILGKGEYKVDVLVSYSILLSHLQ